MTLKTFSPGDVLFTPPEAAKAARVALEYRRDHRAEGIYTGIPAIDRHLTPVLADNLVTVLGRPGSGKTGLMLWWARREATRLAEAGVKNKVVVYVTYEQAVEDLMAFNVAADKKLSIESMARGTLAAADWESVLASLTGAVGLPLAIIGHSMERRQRRPRLTLSNVGESLAYLVDTLKLTPHMVFLDYLQRIPGEKYSGDRRLEVSESLDRCKDAALAFGAPWVVGVQAKREVDTRDTQIPLLADGQETANIEQASDKIFSLVRPCKYRREGEAFGSVTVRGYKQMLISLLKQKLGTDNVSEWIEFNPATNSVEGYGSHD
jgi:replicative DNA helicase